MRVAGRRASSRRSRDRRSESGTRKMPRPAMVLPCLNCAAIATSLVEILRCGAPFTWMLPQPVGLEVAGVDLQLLGGRLHHHAARLARRHHRPRCRRDACRATRSCPCRAGRCRSRRCRHRRPRPARRASRRQICRVTDFMPWPRSIAESDDRELAGRVGVHQRLARIAAEIHADRIVDRRHAFAAMLGHSAPPACRTRRRSASRRAARRRASARAGGRRRRGRRRLGCGRPRRLRRCGGGAAAGRS